MKLELPEKKKLVHTARMAIRWGDMDAMGHVNNTLYFRYLEVARIDWFQRIGCNVNPQGEGPLIVNAFCNFYKQLEYPGDITVKMYASDPGRSSFESWATIERDDDPGTVYAAGGATTVWVDFPKQKSVPMPEWFRELIA
ncbi:MAG TPA: thioesterase family protein [Ramlibacter sp.]|uniref:acyl-CoA thioesterase n=1 Tax=Ramlibacter sp. TaxID=1917967 RepID=UPI002D7E320D|nr:thioesterase family protein [Ramlibacter sp.]HET8747933.1 thioesterase family protein [Ramlibacter sp.]